ncbi:serine hydrolase domain-containing protein [Protaetiibacter larvae]|uniref:Beta-lactamase family protein n=1 Tax=Protaetiibacter larvae TaxID=2592654 RepID=A0A5C1Y4Q5_9MICO|nr:serine hydrolase domain-containing protein [Protaetiibacter larvae]QEO08864.1 beta-lactamase family protein [Protaetiibacter larvae]
MLSTQLRAPGWEQVEAVFRELVESGAEPGGEVAVWCNGVPTLIARGGSSDAAARRPWTAGTLVQVYSAGKPFVALAALLAVRTGFLTLDDPIVRWWRDYRDSPSTPTTLRHILSHTAGKPVFSAAMDGVDPTDAARLIRDLADQAPQTEPGRELAEHAATYGHLVEGLLHAAGAPSIRRCARLLSRVLGLRVRFGVDDDELGMLAELEVLDPAWADGYLATAFGREALLRPPGMLDPAVTNSDRWRRTCFGAINAQTDAVSLARFADDLRDPGGRIAAWLGAELRQEAVSRQAAGVDRFLQQRVEWGLGFRVDGGEVGMGGIGGSAAWYSDRLGYAMAYVTRGLADHARVDAVASAVESLLTTPEMQENPPR